MTPAAPIPLVAHFVWFGAHFPWLNVPAVRSASLRAFSALALPFVTS